LSEASPRNPELPDGAKEALDVVLELLAGDPRAPSSVRDPERAWKVHVADSLAGLDVEELREARRIADVGAGAGFPGIVLAAALPEAHVDLIESIARK
jgi:16S rRNA (guanine527-N7)-methyltransferase